MGDQRLKGKTLAVEAYALQSADRQTAATRHRSHTLPMIGRDDQLAALDPHVAETGDRRGRVVAITAGAGLGKSRLLVEAARLLRDRGIRTYEGEAPAFGARASYCACHDIWIGALGVPASATPDEQRSHLLRAVGDLPEVEIRRALDDKDGMAAPFSNLGVVAEYTSELDRAEQLNEQALALRLEIGNRWPSGCRRTI